jgi:hypothetical protein
MVLIDWDDPEVQAILACRDGGQAWKLLVACLVPVRDAIWARRRECLPKRGGRRSASQREAGAKLLAEAMAEAASMRAEVEMEAEMMRSLIGVMTTGTIGRSRPARQSRTGIPLFRSSR